MLNKAGWLVVGILIAAAAYELSLALRHSFSPDGEWWILLTALLAMLVGASLARFRVRAAWLFAPAAALFVTARFYTGDPYYDDPYRSTFRAYADAGIFSPTWIYVLVGLALAAGATTLLWRGRAPVETMVVLLLLAFTALFMGTGH